ncbi:MAG: hypothetical protein ACLTWO_09865 [Blautia massiliensis (ex Durand et al. 2017)]
MLHEPFGPRGAEDERDGFWTDLGEVTDAAYRDDPATPGRRLETDNALHHAGRPPYAAQEGEPDLEEMPGESIASRQDPLGSWTGVPSREEYETPTQDADDL